MNINIKGPSYQRGPRSDNLAGNRIFMQMLHIGLRILFIYIYNIYCTYKLQNNLKHNYIDVLKLYKHIAIYVYIYIDAYTYCNKYMYDGKRRERIIFKYISKYSSTNQYIDTSVNITLGGFECWYLTTSRSIRRTLVLVSHNVA